MKIKSFLYTTLAATLLFSSCNLNEQPKFDDATQAFIAFSSASGRMSEAIDGVPDTLKIELYCASVAGINASVKVVATDTAYAEDVRAKEEVNFRIEGSTEIKFDADNRFATIKVVSIDNNIQDGDHKFDLVLTDVNGCNLGANKRFSITISDDEDPINMLVGTYSATASIAFEGYPDETWEATVSRDAENPDNIFITPICMFGGLSASAIAPVTAVVDVALGTITVPYGQTIYGGSDQQYNMVIAGLGNDGSPVLSGGMMTTYEMANGEVSFAFSTYGVGNTNANEWWYNAIERAVFTKK